MRFPTKPCESEEKHREREKERKDGWKEGKSRCAGDYGEKDKKRGILTTTKK